MASLTEVQETIARLRAYRAQAGQLGEAARGTADDLQRQLTELRKREDLTGEDMTQTIVTATVLYEDAKRQAEQSGAQVAELTARITALESELPALQRAEQRQRLIVKIDGLQPLVTAYTDAAREFLRFHAEFAQGYSEASRLADRDPTAPSIGVSPLSEREIAAAMRRAEVLGTAELPERLTR